MSVSLNIAVFELPSVTDSIPNVRAAVAVPVNARIVERRVVLQRNQHAAPGEEIGWTADIGHVVLARPRADHRPLLVLRGAQQKAIWSGQHRRVLRIPPRRAEPGPPRADVKFNWLYSGI